MPKITIQRATETYHNREVQIEVERDYKDLATQSDQIVRQIVKDFPKTKRVYESIMSDPRIMAHWELANYIAVVKLGFNDHGPIHAQVVAAAAMQMMQLLHQRGIEFDVVQSGAGELDDAHAVVLAGILLHDIGNQIHRTNHEAFGFALAQPILERHFAPIYPDLDQLQTMIGFTLSTIACHDCNPPPLTMEGAVVAVADATDMTKGRGRVAFDLGKIDIHSVSALAIEAVSIRSGAATPIEIIVSLSNSAGIFQVEEILARKLIVTPLKDYVTIRASAASDYPEVDQRIIHSVVFDHGRFRADDDPKIDQPVADNDNVIN
jgi:metal-dependent HD superfamily phosphatase/phosphodiesterase